MQLDLVNIGITVLKNVINIGVWFYYGFRFIKAKSDVAPGDIHALVELGFEIFHASQDKFVVQVMACNQGSIYMYGNLLLLFVDT
jgi:hypothetical protein